MSDTPGNKPINDAVVRNEPIGSTGELTQGESSRVPQWLVSLGRCIKQNGGVFTVIGVLGSLMLGLAVFISNGIDAGFDSKFEEFEVKFESITENQVSGFQAIDEDFERQETRFETEFAKVEQRFTTVGNSIEAVRSDMRLEFESVRNDIREVRSGLDDIKDDVHEIELKIADKSKSESIDINLATGNSSSY